MSAESIRAAAGNDPDFQIVRARTEENTQDITDIYQDLAEKNIQIAALTDEVGRLKAAVFGSAVKRDKTAVPLNERVKSIMGEVESISGCPAMMKLKDGSLWKLCHFFYINIHIWGWKSGDTVVISKNKSFLSTRGPYIFYNIERDRTSSGNLLYDSEDSYDRLI